MHEATLAESLLRMAHAAIADRPGARVRKVNVSAGALAGVMPDALLFAFDALKHDTPFAAAEMVIHAQKVRAACADCGAEYEPDGFPWICPACRSRHFSVVGGEDVILESLEIET